MLKSLNKRVHATNEKDKQQIKKEEKIILVRTTQINESISTEPS